MAKGNIYTDSEILSTLKNHLVDRMLSKYSMSKPTWRAIKKRMDASPRFEDKVQSIEARALEQWERVGLKALMSNDPDFNVPLFKMYAGAKRSFQSYQESEVEERLDKVELELERRKRKR